MIKRVLSSDAVTAKQYLHFDSPQENEHFSIKLALIRLDSWRPYMVPEIQLVLKSKAMLILKACVIGSEHQRSLKMF